MSKDTSELFEFDKMIFIYLITVGISFFWLLAMIRNKKIIWKKTPLDIPIMLFLASQILSAIFSIDRHTSFFGYYGRFNGGLLSIITYITLLYGFINFFDKEKIMKLLKISLAGSLLVILWGLPGRFGHDMSCLLFTGQFNNTCWTDQFHPESRMFSTLGQPNWLGAYLAINFFLGLYFLATELLSEKSERWTKPQIFFLAYACLNFITILFTRSRSALVSVVIGLVIYIVLLILNRRKDFRQLPGLKNKLFVFGLAILIPILLFKTDIAMIDKFLTLPSSVVTRKPAVAANAPQTKVTSSFDIRKIVWEGAIALGKKYPLFGTGPETFAYSYYFVRPQSHNLTSEWDFLYNKAHNEYLNYFATTGYFGLGTYLILISSFLILMLVRLKSPMSNLLFISFLTGYLTILITNFVGFSTTTVNLFFYLIPAFLIAWSNESSVAVSKENLDARQWFLASIVFIVSVFGVIYFVRYFMADVAYAAGDVEAKRNNLQQSADLLSQALALKYEPVYEDKLSFVLANLAVVASYQKQSDMAKKLVVAADLYNQKTLQDSPKNVLYWKTKAKNQYLFYQVALENNQLMSGIYSLEQAQLLAPTDPKIPYSMSIFYSLMADDAKNAAEKVTLKDKSLQAAGKALLLKPDYEDGYLLKAQLLKKYGKKEEARQTFQYILDKINPLNDMAKKEVAGL